MDDIQIIKNFPVPAFLECCKVVKINEDDRLCVHGIEG